MGGILDLIVSGLAGALPPGCQAVTVVAGALAAIWLGLALGAGGVAAFGLAVLVLAAVCVIWRVVPADGRSGSNGETEEEP